MSILIKDVKKASPAAKAGIKKGELLYSVNGNKIGDVLDYMFYADDDMGLEFGSYLMSDKQSCKNKCIFCFIDQLPKGMRAPLYFKDDDSRLSFLQGNYVTLTNLTKRDIDRIIKMHTPINVSVHTTSPELRAAMMGNPNAGAALETLFAFAEAGITMNCQLVLCPGVNDKEHLVRSLNDLTQYPSIESIACVPVGLTKHRDGLTALRRFTEQESREVIKTVGLYENVYAADEFYLSANIELPPYEHYGTFPQYENGVGMLIHLKHGFNKSHTAEHNNKTATPVSIVTGVAAYPLISELVEPLEHVNVFAIRNDFFGEEITVSGLLTGQDIISQLLPRKSQLGERLLIGANTVNADGLLLDGLTPADIENKLGVKVTVVEPDGEALYKAANFA